MTDLRCPLCGEVMEVEGCKREYYCDHQCFSNCYVPEDDEEIFGIVFATKVYKTKRAAINAARRLLAKMREDE